MPSRPTSSRTVPSAVTADSAVAPVAIAAAPGGMFGRGGPGMGSEALTDLLGLTAEEIHTQLHDGATLAEIAAAQGVEVQAVVDALVAELDTRLDEAVADGRIDQAEADDEARRGRDQDHRHGEQRSPRPWRPTPTPTTAD